MTVEVGGREAKNELMSTTTILLLQQTQSSPAPQLNHQKGKEHPTRHPRTWWDEIPQEEIFFSDKNRKKRGQSNRKNK